MAALNMNTGGNYPPPKKKVNPDGSVTTTSYINGVPVITTTPPTAAAPPPATTPKPPQPLYDPNNDLGISGSTESLWSSGLGAKVNPFITPPHSTEAWQKAMENWGKPSATGEVFGEMKGAYGRPSETKKVLETEPGLTSSSQSFEEWQKQKAALGQPGTYEQWTEENAGRFQEETPLQKLHKSWQGAPTSAQERAQAEVGMLLDRMRGESGERLRGAGQRYGGPGQLNREGDYIRSLYQGVKDVQGFAGRNLGQLEREGMFEDFAQTALTGGNPFLERQREKGLETINQQMAKRGHFTSGGALEALGNYNAAADAEAFKYLSDVLQGAQGMGLQRLAQGQGLAEGASGERFRQGGAMQGLATGRESEYMGRAGALDRYEQAEANRMMRDIEMRAQLAEMADAGRGADADRMAKLAGDTTRSKLDYLTGERDAIQKAQDLMLQRERDRIAGAGAADDREINRIKTRADIAGGLDDLTIKQLNSMLSGGEAVDTKAYQDLSALIQASTGADRATMDAVDQLVNLARGADQEKRGRIAADISRILGVSIEEARMILQAYGGGQ